MGGLFKKPDTSAVERQIAESRAETERQMAATQEERRELAEQAEAKRRARQRGGSRMLLADVRFSPEQGVQTLGSDMTRSA